MSEEANIERLALLPDRHYYKNSDHRWAQPPSEDFESLYAELLRTLERIYGPWKRIELPSHMYVWFSLDDAVQKANEQIAGE